jgi:hypothetical protein
VRDVVVYEPWSAAWAAAGAGLTLLVVVVVATALLIPLAFRSPDGCPLPPPGSEPTS